MKILVCLPNFPFSEKGAEEADRMSGLRQLLRLGHQVHVLSKTRASDKQNTLALSHAKHMGISLDLFPFWRKPTWRRLNPLWLDGAAYEFKDPTLLQHVEKVIQEWRPDCVWLEPSFLWPISKISRKHNVPLIIRSLNFEPLHYLDEQGISLGRLLRAAAKLMGEMIAVRRADIFFSITPKEKHIYEVIGAKRCTTLPLRKLYEFAHYEHALRRRRPLTVMFLGSTYNVRHNLDAARLIVEQIAPSVERRAPGQFIFHILGAKLPLHLQKKCIGNIVYKEYVTDLEAYLSEVDIALSPSLFGAGMQQKVFEPIARGIPTITALRALAKYPLINGEHVLLATSPKEYVNHILQLASPELRSAIGMAGKAISLQLFNEAAMDGILTRELEKIFPQT